MKRIVLTLSLILSFGDTRLAVAQTSSQDPIPYLAYYYIWYTPGSWSRAKSDYPTLGRYSSDDRAVTEQHVKWAKEASVDGFIVSWKATPTLNRRLEQLAEVAAEADFTLWMMYQSLDYERNPLPISQIDHDFEYFASHYADNPAFMTHDKPVVIWSGTWEFSSGDISLITSGYRDRLYILASERDVDGYLRLANAVDGNAYYWSSVDPLTHPNYQEKLNGMSAAIHEHNGLWIAPAAPGFDARPIGGSRVVERNDGKTFRLELNAALRSSPDAIGLISWNEFSENTHIEPSVNYGAIALETLFNGNLSALSQTQMFDFDSSESLAGTTGFNDTYNLCVFGLLIVFLAFAVMLAIVRRIERPKISVSRKM
jgi:hypothetical protein